MAPKGIKAPSRSEPITFPVFAQTWIATPTNPTSARSIRACTGGGGSGKHGIKNLVKIVIDDDDDIDDANDKQHHSSSISRTVLIDTKEQVAFCVTVREVVVDSVPLIWICVGTGDTVQMYTLPVLPPSSTTKDEGATDEAILVSDVNLGKGYGTNSLALSPLNDAVLVGCENGSLRILKWDGKNLKLEITNLEFKGHIKAVCKVEFHPNQPNIVLSSAKDGTCRLWNIQMKPNEACVDVLQCQIYDAKKPPTDQKLLNPKPGQNVVKGCAFGDLEGRIVYTVQSGRKPDKTFKKKGAFLSVWKLVRRVVPVPLVDEEPVPDANGNGNGDVNGAPPSNQQPPAQTQTQPQPQQKREVFQFEEQMRIPVSNYPASAFALSGDFSTIVIGDTDGCVTLLSTTTFKPVKHWAQVHDLPVTCISARPLPMDLAGERNFGVKVDAVSCSADNQMVFLTKQKRSTLKPVKTSGKSGSSFFGILFSFWNILVLALIVFIAKVSHQVCRHEFENGHDLQEIKECVLHTVLWAPITRPGVESVPY